MKQNQIYFQAQSSFAVSAIMITSKIIILLGLTIIFFSQQPTIKSVGTNSTLKTRCSAHICLSNRHNFAWVIDFACCLATINLVLELTNLVLDISSHVTASKLKIILGKIINPCFCYLELSL